MSKVIVKIFDSCMISRLTTRSLVDISNSNRSRMAILACFTFVKSDAVCTSSWYSRSSFPRDSRSKSTSLEEDAARPPLSLIFHDNSSLIRFCALRFCVCLVHFSGLEKRSRDLRQRVETSECHVRIYLSTSQHAMRTVHPRCIEFRRRYWMQPDVVNPKRHGSKPHHFVTHAVGLDSIKPSHHFVL